MHYIANGRKPLWTSQTPLPDSFSWTVSSAQLLLLAESSSSPCVIHDFMTPLISKGHPDNSNTSHFCLWCIKIAPYSYFYSLSEETKITVRFFPPKVVFAEPVPAALPWPLLSLEYVVPNTGLQCWAPCYLNICILTLNLWL